MAQYSKILIVDFGSHSTQLVARRVREAGVYSEILPCTASDAQIKAAAPSAIILSGGPDSISDTNAPKLSPAILELGVPILGICYGMQLLAQTFGGKLASASNREYAPTTVKISIASPLWQGISAKEFSAKMARGDSLTELPKDFVALAEAAGVAAIANVAQKLYGVQFHPEEPATEHGTQILHNFLFAIAGLTADWTMASFVERCVVEFREKVGDSNVVLALSGGVDSAVVAALLHRAIGKQLYCIFVDHGLMRHKEAENVIAALNKHLPGLNLQHIKGQELFLGKLAGVEDPEQKRKIIGHTFIEVFDAEAKKLPNVRFLAQGTIYPDIIESYSPKGTVIKSHHNVGGLPDEMKLDLVEPLRELFKDEVRAVGEELGLPKELVWRHPFPGPGLGVRVLGAVSEDRLSVLRAADHIVQEELRSSGWYDKVWQGFAVLLPLRTVGMRGDQRTYDNVIALRIVNSIDAMTAEWARIPDTLLDAMSRRILSEVPGVNRVVYDVSSKPPSTIEWE